MRNGVEVRLNPGDRERLETVVADRNSLQKHVWRAEIVLLTAIGLDAVDGSLTGIAMCQKAAS